MRRVLGEECMDEWCSAEGLPSPLGVTWIEKEEAFNFALYSKHATDVTLLLYSCSENLTITRPSSSGTKSLPSPNMECPSLGHQNAQCVNLMAQRIDLQDLACATRALRLQSVNC